MHVFRAAVGNLKSVLLLYSVNELRSFYVLQYLYENTMLARGCKLFTCRLRFFSCLSRQVRTSRSRYYLLSLLQRSYSVFNKEPLWQEKYNAEPRSNQYNADIRTFLTIINAASFSYIRVFGRPSYKYLRIFSSSPRPFHRHQGGILQRGRSEILAILPGSAAGFSYIRVIPYLFAYHLNRLLKSRSVQASRSVTIPAETVDDALQRKTKHH